MLYTLFPRQISIPYRITVDKDDFYKEINKYNGKKRIFASVYNYTDNPAYNRIALVIDKVFFDFDKNPYENLTKFLQRIYEFDYKHLIVFSGGGYHVYLFTDKQKLKNPKVALYQFQSNLTKDLKIDRTSFGDVARVSTIPNTYNTKRKRYAIPISIEDIARGHEYIIQKSENQVFNFITYGNNLVRLQDYDNDYECDTEAFDEPVFKSIATDLPPCLNYILSLDKKGYRARFLLINYLKHNNYLLSQIEDIITSSFSKEESYHCIKEERQVNVLYWKDIVFPCCESVKMEGFCPLKEWCDYTRPYGNKHIVRIYR